MAIARGTAALVLLSAAGGYEMCFLTDFYYRDDDSQPLPHLPGCLPADAGLPCSARTVAP